MTMTMTYEGNGILSGTHNPEAIDLRIEEERRKELAAAQRDAARETTAAVIERALMPQVREELMEEMAERKLSAKTLSAYSSDFQRFKKCCASWDLPHLPAPPQVVAAFLADECDRGHSHLSRVKAAIAAAHHAADLPDPTEDLLVKAVLRLSRKNPGGRAATTDKED